MKICQGSFSFWLRPFLIMFKLSTLANATTAGYEIQVIQAILMKNKNSRKNWGKNLAFIFQ